MAHDQKVSQIDNLATLLPVAKHLSNWESLSWQRVTSTAHRFLSTALCVDATDPAAWSLLGRALTSHMRHEEAADAYLNSVKCTASQPVLPYSIVKVKL